MPIGSGPMLQSNLNVETDDDNMPSEDNNGSNNGHTNGGSKLPTVSYDHTSYVQRARVTRPVPPKPSANPMQFVQIKPCNLYQQAQEQLKRAEEVKKVKEIKKEEPEDWQNNLDNWKSSRRKRVEHIIDRVVEVKKLELEEHDRTRRKSKTFSEMMEEKKTKRSTKLAAIMYEAEESNDFSDLGIGTSSASGKSSLSEDYDNQSVMSDNVDNDKHSIDLDHPTHHHEENNSGSNRDYMSSPGYDTSSSTAPASSPDPCEYTYEGAIQDYKTRISKAQITSNYNNGFRNGNNNIASDSYSKDSTPERQTTTAPPVVPARRTSTGPKIENRLMSFEIKSACDLPNDMSAVKKDLPKVNILKRRELFEKETTSVTVDSEKRNSSDFSNNKTLKERLSNLEKSKALPAEPKSTDESKSESNHRRLSNDIPTIRGRMQNLEKQNSQIEKTTKIDVPVVPLKDRLSSLHSAATKEEAKKPVVLIDAHQLEILKQEDLLKQQQLGLLKDDRSDDEAALNSSHEILNIQDESNLDTDREDSGIHTTDVSCSVSQTDEHPELCNEEAAQHHINANDGLNSVEQQPIIKLTSTESSSLLGDFVPMKPPIPSARTHINTTATTITETHQVKLEDSSIASPEPLNDLDASVNEALEIALQAIDSEEHITNFNNEMMEIIVTPLQSEPIYENIYSDPIENPDLTTSPSKQPSLPSQSQVPVNIEKQQPASSDPEDDQEPYYQVPKSSEPYYEVPKYLNQRPVPVYENIEIFFPTSGAVTPLAPLDNKMMEPPKEKPPPPPVDDDVAEETIDRESGNKKSAPNSNGPIEDIAPMKRMNSTKRIKKELRNKRSSFLGIEGTNDDETYLELTVAPPPDMAQLLQEEKRLEKQLYMKAGLYDSSDTGESRDSGVSENHSRQSSEPFTNSSEEHEDLLVQKEKEIIEVLEKEEEKQRSANNLHLATPVARNDIDMKQLQHCLIDDHQLLLGPEQDEILRVERELLQLEQEELKRQRENLLLRTNLARNELDHGAKMLMSANRRSMNDISSSTAMMQNSSIGHYANLPPLPQQSQNRIYQVETDYRKSMSDLYEMKPTRPRSLQPSLQHALQPPIPPAKPMRSNIIIDSRHSSGLVKIASPTRVVQHAQSIDELAPLRNYQLNTSPVHAGNMSRHTLHALSAAPKPKFTDAWIQSKTGIANTDKYANGSPWISYQEKRRSVPESFNCNKHWLVQEAEQRRIEQQRGLRTASLTNGWSTNNTSPTKSAIQRNGSHDNKPLPEAVIQTLTQRVQSKGIGERRRLDQQIQSGGSSFSSTTSLLSISTPQLNQLNISNSTISEAPSDKILSVSGKKKCSHCGEELGRGAAMIIESLRLFYHIDCFKCCVCHVQLSDGLNGTDVRVRNQKLHCQNCYSSDDGIKFSCV